MAKKHIDPITAEVIRCGLETIANEMGITMTQTATTPIFSEAHDFSTAIFDYQGRMIALAQAITIHMGAMKYSVQAALDYFGPEKIYHGDIILLNDPYYGGSHVPDWTMFTPIFYEGELIIFPATRCHMVDTGGAVPGGYYPQATDIWQEGLRLSPIKIYERGKPREDIIRMLQVNNRCPTFIGDLQAMIGSNKVGERRIMEILRKYGKETIKDCLDYILDYAERRFRQEIKSWPNGKYKGEAFLEHDCLETKDIKVQVEVTIEDDSLILDYTGSDRQTPGFVNSSVPNTFSWLFLTLGCMIDESIPKNEGLFRPIDVILPKGTVVNPIEPAPCTACTVHLGAEVAEALAVALAQAVPEKAFIPNLKLGMPIVIFGKDPKTGEFWLDQNIDFAGWCGAVYGQDGWGAAPCFVGGITLATSEMNEIVFPLRVVGKEFVTDSGGAGKWRGGPGNLFVKAALAPLTANVYVVGNRYPMRGIHGGKAAAPSKYYLRYGSKHQMEVETTGFMVEHEPGEMFYAMYGGGGGWGDPLEREPEKVLEDVLDEYISLGAAEKDYGVVIKSESLEIDYPATQDLRQRLRTKRG